MPRKAFIADVTACGEKPGPRITGVVRGGDDGDVNFVFSPLADGPPIELSALALDVSEYPNGNTWMLFARSSDLPNGVEPALEEFAAYSAGMTLAELLSAVSERLQKILATGFQGDPFRIDDSSDVEMVDGDEEEESDEAYFDNYSDLEDGPGTTTSQTHRLFPENAAKLNRRIKEDLRAVRFAGFKVGILSGLKADSRTSLVSISLQASRLGLSEEALQAWDLEPNQYVVLLIRYSYGYKTFEMSKFLLTFYFLPWRKLVLYNEGLLTLKNLTAIQEPARSNDIAFRIGVSNKYKPTITEALASFADISKNASKTANDEKLEVSDHGDENTAGKLP